MAGHAVVDLVHDPAGRSADHRVALPHRLGHDQPEPLTCRLLDHHVTARLERVDLQRVGQVVAAQPVQRAQHVDVGVVPGVGEGRGVELQALRVVVRHVAHQRQLHVRHALLHQPVGVDHAQRVLPRIEPGDLGHQRPAAGDPEPALQDVTGQRPGQPLVLRRQRVDRWVDVLDPAQVQARRHVVRQREDPDLVVPHERGEELERALARGRGVDVTPPDPAARPPAVQDADQTRGLRIVDDHEVPVGSEDVHVLTEGGPVDVPQHGRELDLHPLEAVVELLGEVEERVVPRQDVPLGVQAEAALQGHEGMEDLGDAAAVRGGVQVEDARVLKRRGSLLDLRDHVIPDERSILVDRLRAQLHPVSHHPSEVRGSAVGAAGGRAIISPHQCRKDSAAGPGIRNFL